MKRVGKQEAVPLRLLCGSRALAPVAQQHLVVPLEPWQRRLVVGSAVSEDNNSRVSSSSKQCLGIDHHDFDRRHELVSLLEKAWVSATGAGAVAVWVAWLLWTGTAEGDRAAGSLSGWRAQVDGALRKGD